MGRKDSHRDGVLGACFWSRNWGFKPLRLCSSAGLLCAVRRLVPDNIAKSEAHDMELCEPVQCGRLEGYLQGALFVVYSLLGAT